METVFIVTEANEYVATGHLMECIVCTKELMRLGYQISFWINQDVNETLKNKIPCCFQEYQRSIENDYNPLLGDILLLQPIAVLFNLREITENFLREISKHNLGNTKLICIDEFGHRNLPADIIINPMIDPFYWNYGESKACLFCGAEYLVLSKELKKFHVSEKIINDEINKIVITMGGVDPKNYTVELTKVVPQSFPEAGIKIVLGGGNQNKEIVREMAKEHKTITILENVSNLLEIIYKSDLILCAGGNTLHEAACIGTPAIVLPSMPHERRTAKCFAKKGFGLVVNTKNDWKKEIAALFHKINSLQLRKDMSRKGKCISDGLGWKRIIEIIKEI